MIGGALQVVRWGNRRGESDQLPPTLWTQLATIEAGGWADAQAEEVVIPAALGRDGGIWFPVKTGIRGLMVPDEKGVKHVYAIVEPANHYYATMTKAEWMPALLGEEFGELKY